MPPGETDIGRCQPFPGSSSRVNIHVPAYA
jgi:hypothetical protein